MSDKVKLIKDSELTDEAQLARMKAELPMCIAMNEHCAKMRWEIFQAYKRQGWDDNHALMWTIRSTM